MNSTIEIILPEAVSEESLAAFVQILPFESLSFSSKRQTDAFSGPWELLWVVEGEPDAESTLNALNNGLSVLGIAPITQTELTIKELPDINWLEASYQSFEPFSAGRFFIHGAHFEDQMPEGSIPLEIDASIAFGSGEHGTTHGCLKLIDQLHQNGYAPKNILDMGCGSGILAVAAAKLWPVPTLAIDIEDDAKILTDQHAESNGVEAYIDSYVGDGFETQAVKKIGHFDFIIANILPVVLKPMAPDIELALNKDGYLILSGILQEQADNVINVYDNLGLTLEDRIDIGDWVSLLYKK